MKRLTFACLLRCWSVGITRLRLCLEHVLAFSLTPKLFYDMCFTGVDVVEQVQFRQIGPGMVQQLQSACSSCRGEGKVINERDKCKTCSAKKVGFVSVTTLSRCDHVDTHAGCGTAYYSSEVAP